MLARCSPTLLSQLRALAVATAAGTRNSISNAAGNAAAAQPEAAGAADGTGSPRLPVDGLTLQEFVRRGAAASQHEGFGAAAAAAPATVPRQPARLAYIETYGW